jgi:hypothetical protein
MGKKIRTCLHQNSMGYSKPLLYPTRYAPSSSNATETNNFPRNASKKIKRLLKRNEPLNDESWRLRRTRPIGRKN